MTTAEKAMQDAMGEVLDRIYGFADGGDWNGIASMLDEVSINGMDGSLAYSYYAYTYPFSGIAAIGAARDRYAERLHTYLIDVIGRERADNLLRDRHNMPPVKPAQKPDPIVRKPFVSETYRGVLREIAGNPPSDNMIDTSLVAEVRAIVPRLDAMSDADVWNEYKRLLDHVVRYASAAPAIQTLLDLEAYYTPPVGGYAQADGTINDAPWRQETER
jgi:hypothetical protein